MKYIFVAETFVAKIRQAKKFVLHTLTNTVNMSLCLKTFSLQVVMRLVVSMGHHQPHHHLLSTCHRKVNFLNLSYLNGLYLSSKKL